MSTLDLLTAYEARFGDTSELIPFSLHADPKLAGALRRALDTGRALTVNDVEQQFGPLEWEECEE